MADSLALRSDCGDAQADLELHQPCMFLYHDRLLLPLQIVMWVQNGSASIELMNKIWLFVLMWQNILYICSGDGRMTKMYSSHSDQQVQQQAYAAKQSLHPSPSDPGTLLTKHNGYFSPGRPPKTPLSMYNPSVCIVK